MMENTMIQSKTEQKSRIKTLTPVMYNGVHNTFTNDYGTFFTFNVEFENGDYGILSSKKQEGNWKVGSQYTYDVVVNGQYVNIRNIKPAEIEKKYTNYGRTYGGLNTQTYTNAQIALISASRYIASRNGSNYDNKAILQLSDLFLGWLEKSDEKTKK